MIRHEALADYTRDHLVMLSHAQALHKAASTGPKDGLAAAQRFQRYWTSVMAGYLREVEEILQPRLEEKSLQGRYNMLTTALRNAVDELRVTLMEPAFFRGSLFTLASALRSYVQYAEGHMLVDIQVNHDDAGLAKVRQASLSFRKTQRPNAIGDGRTEPTFLA